MNNAARWLLKKLGYLILITAAVFVFMNLYSAGINKNSSDFGDRPVREKANKNGLQANPDKVRLYPVLKVIDGDSLEVEVNGELKVVRLIGIEAPEVGDASEGSYGRKSRAFLDQLLDQKRVRLVIDSAPADRFGRSLAYVYTEDGVFVNAELVREGYARSTAEPPNIKYGALFAELEKSARKSDRGLWAILGYRLENPPE